jgi:hypothetical protein
LVGLDIAGVVVWNEEKDEQLWKICSDFTLSIKRVITTKNYMIKTNGGVKLLTIDDLEPSKFSLQHMLDSYEVGYNHIDSLQLQITHSHITVATSHNSWTIRGAKLIKVPLPEM